MVDKSNFTEVEIWRHINYLRFKRFKKTPYAHHEKRLSCDVEKLSHLLGMKNISDRVNEELSKSTTKLLDEMFLTLTEPPSYFERLYNITNNYIWATIKTDNVSFEYCKEFTRKL